LDFLPELDQKSMELLITASPLPNIGQHAALLIVEDITAKDELEQALHRSEKLAVAGRRVATIAHEINNPLESLSSILHVLSSDPSLEENVKELVELAKRDVEQLANISRRTLAPHRQSEFSAATKVCRLLDDVMSKFQRRLQEAEIEVFRSYEREAEVAVHPSEFQQVFTNLIANAIDAIGKHGTLRLSVSTRAEGRVAVKIIDSGCGISPEHLGTIFEPLFTTKGEEGTGIGLWVVKGIIEKAGGTIAVTSSTSGVTGTCFTISLPSFKAARK
jgi:signal transduction histidine kinase